MCYSPPGPRCSHHAYQELLKAVRRLDVETNSSKKLLLQEKVDTATAAYYSTPRGMNELRREIALLSTEAKTNPDVVSVLTDKRILLRKGELTRKNQLEAFFAVQQNRNSTVKENLPTGNKQKQAVGILFNHLLQFEPNLKVHVNDDRTIEVASAEASSLILVVPQKQQNLIVTVKKNLDGSFSPSEEEIPPLVLNVLKIYDSFSNIPEKDKLLLQGWVINSFKNEGVSLFGSVDVKTEHVLVQPIEKLFQSYELEVKKKPKLGGTANYKYGDTEELRKELEAVDLKCEIATVVVNNQTKTVLYGLSYLPTAKQQHLGKFFLAEGVTEAGKKYYEVRRKHQSSLVNVFVEFRRKENVILSSNVTSLASFLTPALDI